MNYISPCLNPCEGPLPGGAAVKNLLPMQETQVQSLGGEDSLEGIAPFPRVVRPTPGEICSVVGLNADLHGWHIGHSVAVVTRSAFVSD